MPRKTSRPSAFPLSFTFAMVLAITTMTGIAVGQSMLEKGMFTAQVFPTEMEEDDESTAVFIGGESSSLSMNRSGTVQSAQTGTMSASSPGSSASSSSSSSFATKQLPSPAVGQTSSSYLPPIPPVFSSSSSSFDEDDDDEYRKRMEEEAKRIREEQEEAARRARELMEEQMKRANTETGTAPAIPTAPGTPEATGCYDASGLWTQDITKCDWNNQRTHYENAQQPSSSPERPVQPTAPAVQPGEREVEVLVENRFVEQKRGELLTGITEGRQRLATLLTAGILPAASIADAKAVHDWLLDMYAYYLTASVTLDDLQNAGTVVRDTLARVQEATETIRAETANVTDPRLEYIVSRLNAIIGTVPKIVAVFERERLPVSFEMLNAYVQAEDLLRRALDAGCPQKQEACTGLNDVIGKLQITSDAIKKTLDERATDAIRREVEGL